MAQTGYTPILIYGSGTTGNTPSAGNLTSSSAGAELAINYFDGKLFYKDNAGVVQTLATKGTGSIGGSTTQVQYNNAGALAGSANLTFNGTTLTANALTVSTGNLTFSGTAQRITGDFSNATVANRLMFQTSTVNGNTSVAAIPNGTSVQANIRAFANSDPTNASFTDIGADPTVGSFLRAERAGTGTYLPMTFYTGGSERVRVDTSGNVGIGTATTGSNDRVRVEGAEARIRSRNSTSGAEMYMGSMSPNEARLWASTSSDLTLGTNNAERMRIDASGNVGIGTASPTFKLVSANSGTDGGWLYSSGAVSVLGLGGYANAGDGAFQIRFDRSTGNITFNTGTRDTPVERMRIDSSGNVGIGTASPSQLVEASLSQNGKTQVKVTNVNAGANTSAGVLFGSSSGDNGYIGANGGAASSALGGANAVQVTNLTANPVVLATNNTERMRIDSSGNIVAGASAALATNATNGFLYVPTCAGTPTGVPTAITGMAPIVVNTTNNKLYFYSGGAWRDAGP
jgi:hypothetical protein